MLTLIGQEHSQLPEIDVGHWITAVTFTANGEHLVSGGGNDVRVWQVKDGKQVAAMRVKHSVASLAVSKDGQWIAAGLSEREVVIWDTSTYEQTTYKTFFTRTRKPRLGYMQSPFSGMVSHFN